MNNRQRALAVLNYENCDRLPVVHFGFWRETLEKWCKEGHLKPFETENIRDGSAGETNIAHRLGFDFNWYNVVRPTLGLHPQFETKMLEVMPDGFYKWVNGDGVIIMEKTGVVSIPREVDHLLKSRSEWEEHFIPRLQFTRDRIDYAALEEYKDDSLRVNPVGLYCGSLLGEIRNWLGIEGLSYLFADDMKLLYELTEKVGDLCYHCVEAVLSTGVKFDFAHFWEDVCFKNGPLVNPVFFEKAVGPYYKRITGLLSKYDINIVSVDCDGVINSLISTWIDNGVNTMFPIEVGTWNGNIKPWRIKYGRALRGVGGMNKNVFACDYAAVDSEINRLKPLIELGGFIPCPDHRIPVDAKWENIQYYCERMRQVFK